MSQTSSRRTSAKIQEVARLAGVSIATVSRTFNLPEQVKPATRSVVEGIARQLAYYPNRSASTLRTQRSKVLGVVLPTLLNPVFAECMAGIAVAAKERGYAIIHATTEYQLANEEQAVSELQSRSVDGFILVVSNPRTSRALERVRAQGVPYVLLYSREAGHPCISVDGEKALEELIERLAGLGHRRIAMVSGQLQASDRAQQRYRGFVAGMSRLGLDASSLIEVPFVETAVGRLAELLAQRGRPSALVCSNDLLAIRAIRAAHLAGLVVPRDLSVVGFDGIRIGEDMTPMLSTIVQPNEEMGRRSIALVSDAQSAASARRPVESVSLEYYFREGESCARAPEGYS